MVSDDTGRDEVYVVSVPSLTEKWPVSSGGGTAPRWRRDGRELFYVSADGMLQSVATTTTAAFRAGTAKASFSLEAIRTDGYTYAVSRDGQRVLVARPTGGVAPTTLTVVLNWAEGLRQ